MTHPWPAYGLIGLIGLMGAYSAALVLLNCRRPSRDLRPAGRGANANRKRPMIAMNRCTVPLLLLALLAPRARAHFLFVVPEPGGAGAKVILSEDLEPDSDVPPSAVASAKLTLRNPADGREAPLALAESGGAMRVAFPSDSSAADQTRVIHGVEDLGVRSRGATQPYRLVYHPKTILGNAADPRATLGAALTPVEIAPVVGGMGDVAFEVLIDGKPKADVEVNVILPGGQRDKATTDATGRTHPFAQAGTFGAWARYFEPKAGEVDGKSYAEVRHYATLVATVGSAATPAPTSAATQASATVRPAPKYAPMPEAVSSFGAVATGGWLYVYGGHVAPTHNYSTAAVSGQFHRLNLTDGKTWETLPGGPHVQGMNLATHDGKVYRVGGMEPRNAPGEPADNYSLTDAACFDPATGKWESLPSLPQGRSSHDVAVIGNTLYVIGGWTMNGSKGGNQWPDAMLTMDLSKSPLQWTTVKQPFQRRALIVAAHQGRLFVMGGFDEASEASREVSVFDPKSGAWSKAPELPGKDRNGFAPAACEGSDGHLYVSVADGTLYRLNEAAGQWDKAGATTPRIVHRLAPWRSEILVIGGAAAGKNFDLIESVEVPARAAGAALR